MLFNSYIFIFLFFPLCLAGLYLLEHFRKGKAAKIWLVGLSFWFYGYFNRYYLAIMLGSIVFNFIVAQLLWRFESDSLHKTEDASPKSMKRGKAALAVGICVNLAVLGYFKYYDFFVENINLLFKADFALKHILLPLGISFFTFQQIGFLMDVYRGEAQKCRLTEYALFVSFFPQLVAGPIVNYTEMMPQFAKIGLRQFQWDKFTGGLYLFTLGLAKKVLLADTFGIAVDAGYGNIAALSGTDAWLVMLFYTLQLYFDFSGYCDMARGLGHMMGIEIPVNFNSPYKASNIIDFWKRWHITLNRFLMRYVYIPLGGNRKGTVRTYINLLLVFFVSGFWHGAGWNFIVWGMLHGALYVLTRAWQTFRSCFDRRKAESAAADQTAAVADQTAAAVDRTVAAADQMAAAVAQTAAADKSSRGKALLHVSGVVFTFLYVNLAWIFFRAPNLTQAGEFITRMVQGGFKLPSPAVYNAFNLDEFWYVLKILHLDRLPHSDMFLGIGILLFSLGIVFFHKNAGEMEESFQPRVWNMLGTAVLFGWCVLSLSGVSTFLYFNF